MDIAVIGAGGVGGYFGAVLARKGVRVHFVARGRHLEAIRNSGLRVAAASGEFTVHPESVEADARAVPGCDFVLLCTKNYDLRGTIAALRPFAGERACFVPLLNGVDAVEQLRSAFPERTLGGQCSVLAELIEPGVIRQALGPQQIVVGELGPASRQRAESLCRAFQGSEVDISLSETIRTELWIKLIYISCFATVVAATRTSIGEVLACAETRVLCQRALREAIAVASAEGIALSASLADNLLARAESLERSTQFSLLRDLNAGRRLEIDALNGAIARRGRERNVPAPTHEFLYAILRPAHVRALAASAVQS